MAASGTTCLAALSEASAGLITMTASAMAIPTATVIAMTRRPALLSPHFGVGSPGCVGLQPIGMTTILGATGDGSRAGRPRGTPGHGTCVARAEAVSGSDRRLSPSHVGGRMLWRDDDTP